MSLQDDAHRTLARVDDEELLTVKEYAERRRVHIQTVYTAIRQGRFKLAIEYPTGGRAIRIRVPRGSIPTLSPA